MQLVTYLIPPVTNFRSEFGEKMKMRGSYLGHKRRRESVSSEVEHHETEGDSGLGQDKSESEDDHEMDREESPVPEGQYEVENILDFVRDVTGDLYHVKWKGWDEDANTWEPPSSLVNCTDSLLRFYIKRKAEIDLILEQSEYVVVNGKKRRKGPPLKIQLPPDPRPLQVRAEEFYHSTEYPDLAEVEVRFCKNIFMFYDFKNVKSDF